MKTLLGMLALMVALGVTGASAQEKTRFPGAWEGVLKLAPEKELRFILKVEKGKDGALTASLDSPDEGLDALPIDSISDKAGKVTFTSKKLSFTYEGKWNSARTELTGEWLQRGAKFPLTFKKADPAKLKAAAMIVPKELEGTWEGKLALNGGISLRLVLRVEKGKDGALKAVLLSPDQTPAPIPVSAIALKDGKLTFENKLLGAKFAGKKNKDGTEYAGDFEQGGAKFPLTLKKTDKVSEARRPQTPMPPFPYLAEDVTYENKAGGVTLAGTLTIPKAPAPFPAVLLITGSGAQDRDETLLGHKPFLVLADALTRRGIAVLRVDDRGVGDSSGNHATATSEDFASDVLAGVAFLKSRTEIAPEKIGLVGHSEGGIIAPMAATRSRDVAYIVLMAGTALPGDMILEMQRSLIARAGGMKEDAIKKQNVAVAKLIAAVRAEQDPKALAGKIAALTKELIADLPEEERKAVEGTGMVEAQTAMLGSPWFRYFLTYDPRPTLTKVRCPVLAINGEKDLQVPPKENLGEIEKALKAGGNEHFKIQELPGLNHLFQTSKTGAPSEYADIEETISPDALKVIGDWILERTKS